MSTSTRIGQLQITSCPSHFWSKTDRRVGIQYRARGKKNYVHLRCLRCVTIRFEKKIV
jgi:hypothetical protein